MSVSLVRNRSSRQSSRQAVSDWPRVNCRERTLEPKSDIEIAAAREEADKSADESMDGERGLEDDEGCDDPIRAAWMVVAEALAEPLPAASAVRWRLLVWAAATELGGKSKEASEGRTQGNVMSREGGRG